MATKIRTYTWDETDTPDENGQVKMTVKTAANPNGYDVMVPAADDFAKVATIESLWANQGKPAN